MRLAQCCRLAGRLASTARHSYHVHRAVVRQATLMACMERYCKQQADVTTPEMAAHLCDLQSGRHSLQTGDCCLEQALQRVHREGSEQHLQTETRECCQLETSAVLEEASAHEVDTVEDNFLLQQVKTRVFCTLSAPSCCAQVARSAEKAINLTGTRGGPQAAAPRQSQVCASDDTGQVTVNSICCTCGDRKAFHVLQELPFQRPSEFRLQLRPSVCRSQGFQTWLAGSLRLPAGAHSWKRKTSVVRC